MYPQNVISNFKLRLVLVVSALIIISLPGHALWKDASPDNSQETVTLTRALPKDTLLFNTIDSILTEKRVRRTRFAEISIVDKWRFLPHECLAIYIYYNLYGCGLFKNSYYVKYKNRQYIFNKNDEYFHSDIRKFIRPMKSSIPIVYNEKESVHNITQTWCPIVLVYNCDGTLSHYEQETDDYIRFVE